jgi:simple sugar transport system ATP-binding protein
MSNYVVEMKDVRLSYGAVRALDGVSLELAAGEVLALVGDNGAGKSSLVKVITGYARPTGGELLIGGERVDTWSPVKARSVGVEVVYQDLALVEDINLWRNFFLANELHKKWGPFRTLDRKQMMNICSACLSEIGLGRSLSVKARAEVLSGGERQALAIMRAVHFGRIALLLDEPVAALATRETRRVFNSIQEAKARGLGIVYVDHNMAHVRAIADRIAIVDAGRIRTVVKREEVTLADLVSLVEGGSVLQDADFGADLGA